MAHVHTFPRAIYGSRAVAIRDYLVEPADAEAIARESKDTDVPVLRLHNQCPLPGYDWLRCERVEILPGADGRVWVRAHYRTREN